MKKCTIDFAYAAKGFASINPNKGIITACLLSIILLLNNRSSIAQANTELSNLVSPTKVNVNLQPTTDNSKSLGTDSKSWKDLYMDGYLYLDGYQWLANPGSDNTMLGKGAGISTTGADNTFVGKEAGVSNTTGNGNTFIGEDAGWQNTTGYRGVSIGMDAGYHNTTGFQNTFIGTEAGFYNANGAGNTAVGHQCLYNNVGGAFNAAYGYSALFNSTTGSNNAAFGTSSMYYNTSGRYNSAFGTNALTDNTAGEYNCAFGYQSCFGNVIGNYNSSYGAYALLNNEAAENSAFGYKSLVSNTEGIKNVAVGTQAGISNTTGNYGVFVGYDAGGSNTTGSQNTYIGYSAEGSSSLYTNVVGIGYQLTNTASNQARIGNSSTTSVGGWASWSNVSDGRFKKNVKEDVSGLVFINKLRPVTYNLDVHAADDFVGKEFSKDHETTESDKISEQAKSEKEKIVYSGFIAQEVETAAKEIGYDFSGVDAPKNEHDLYGLRYAEFVVPLVKSVQELSVTNDVKDEQIRDLQNENAALLLRIENIEKQLGIATVKTTNSIQQRAASLEQNVPNPAKNSTIIHYYVPQDVREAMLLITDANGRTIEEFNQLTNGQTEIEFSTTNLSSGTYRYSLYVEGRMVDSKQMVITK